MPGVRGEDVKANVQSGVWLKTNRSCLTCMLILLFSGQMPRVSLLVFNPSTQMTRKNHRSYRRIIRSLGSSAFASSHIERRTDLMLEYLSVLSWAAKCYCVRLKGYINVRVFLMLTVFKRIFSHIPSLKQTSALKETLFAFPQNLCSRLRTCTLTHGNSLSRPSFAFCCSLTHTVVSSVTHHDLLKFNIFLVSRLLMFHFLIAPLVDLLSCWTTKHWCNLAEYDQLEATRCVRLISPRGRKDDATCDREEMQTQNRKSQLSPTAFLRYLCPCPKDLGHVMFSKFKL